MFVIFLTKIWYGKTLSCRTSLKSGTAAAVPAVPAAPPMPNTSTWAPQPIIIIIVVVVVVVVVVVADEYCEDHSVHSLVSRLQSQRRFKVTVSL